MRIAIDISQVVYGTGVSVYTENLVKNLLKIDQENEYCLFAGTLRRKKDILRLFPQTKILPISPMMADFVWNRFHTLPIDRLVCKIDIYHSSDWAEAPTNAFKVTTIHDLYPLKFPRLIHPVVREVHKRRLSWVLRESERIIVPSESTKRDLIYYGGVEEKIRVIPEAPSIQKASLEGVDRVTKKYNLKGDYLISIGISKLKNTLRIIKAFHLARAGHDVKLVLIGRPSGIKIPDERNIRVLGHVESGDMAGLIAGSRGLVFPSLYEGFGIPILDAFVSNVPVVTSNVSSMAEVADNAACIVDPTDVDSIADGIQKILRGPKSFIEKGEKRVKEFTWEKTARQTLEIYNEAKQ